MKRHRVRLRPKALRRRRFAAFVLLLAAAAVPLRNMAARLPRPRWSLASFAAACLPAAAGIDAVLFRGAPESLQPSLLASLHWRPGERWSLARPYRARRELSERFPCLDSVRVSRSWTRRSVLFEVSLRAPIARVAGERPLYLDEKGVIFPAPKDLFADSALTRVELPPAAAGRAAVELAGLLTALQASGSLPSTPTRMRLAPDGDGWSAELADGTRLLWGDLRWTREKLSRLREVLADAGPRFGRGLTADLRQFEDGKIFVRPK